MTARGPLDRLRSRVVLAIVVVGALSAATIGGVSGGLALVGGGLAVFARLQPPLGGSWRGANIAVLLGCVALAAASDYKLEVAQGLVAWLQIHRAVAGRRPADDRVAILLALLQLLLACVLSISGWLAPLFLLFAVLVPLGLLLCHVVEAAPEAMDPTLGAPPRLGALPFIGPATAVLTVLFFFTLPRLEAGGIGAGGEQVGLGDEVRIGELGDLKDNPSVALRATVRNAQGEVLSGPFYFRGTTFDHFSGDRWTSTLKGASERGTVGRTDIPEVIRQDIVLEPLQDGILVGMPSVARMEIQDGRRVERDLNGVWRQKRADGRLSYTVWSVPPGTSSAADPIRAATARAERAALRSGVWSTLPPDLDPRIPALAAEIVKAADVEGDPFAEARALESYLLSTFEYTLIPEPTIEHQPLAGFLFESKRGHCEYFATALAVFLRTRNIPSRVVGGFYGGAANPFADWVLVRQSDAHAWVEAWVEGRGWVQLDATPASAVGTEASLVSSLMDLAGARWQGVILDYGLETQVEAILGASSLARGLRLPGAGGAVAATAGGSVVLLVVGVVVLVSLGLGIRVRRQNTQSGKVARIHRRARRWVARRGWSIPSSLPPVEAAQWLVERAGDTAEPLLELAWMYYEVRLGGQDDHRVAKDAADAWRRLQALPKRRRG